MYSTEAIGKKTIESPYEKFTIQRGWTSEDDVDIDIKYCGFCHTDVHLARNDWGFSQFPNVPGHEIAGVVTKVGSNVKDINVGDHVGIGYYMDSCLDCNFCKTDEEPLCDKGITGTAAGIIQHGRIKTDSGYPYGGWSKKITANRRFVSVIPKSYPLEKAGPVFCGGITMFFPLKKHGAAKGGLKIGIAGFGGLGQMGVLLAKSMGNHVTVISTSNKKEALAKQVGADNYVISKDEESMAANAQTLDLVLDTIPMGHDINPYMTLLKKKGTINIIGAFPDPPFQLSPFTFIMNAYNMTGTATGGMQVTQECINFMDKHNLEVKTEMITSIAQLEKAEAALVKGNDSGVRYVIDMGKILA